MALTLPFYFLFVVALAVLLTTAMRKLRGDDNQPASAQEDEAFERRMAKIEQKFGGEHTAATEQRENEPPS
ncbi:MULTISPECIES: hypothetical protein [unclassified Novosphingobium]|uniref:hypothetical protein n=1 Tax=unclassified Novosphingobium TaxID=2644732 RepID=UPI001358F74E|nr:MULTISPECIES: hypothetical protein [unclassified Novosphingobium]